MKYGAVFPANKSNEMEFNRFRLYDLAVNAELSDT